MNNNQIQQIKNPRKIYQTPTNHFVTKFVNNNNILTKTIYLSNNNHMTINTKHDNFVIPTPNPTPTKNNILELMINTDLTTVSNTTNKYENIITNKLINKEFINSMITLYIDINKNTIFRIQKQQHELNTLNYTTNNKLFTS